MRQQNSNQMINLLPQSQSMIDPLQTSTLTVSSLGEFSRFLLFVLSQSH